MTGALTGVLAAAAGDAADEAEELVLELRGELGHGAVEGRASCGGTKKGSSPESSSGSCFLHTSHGPRIYILRKRNHGLPELALHLSRPASVDQAYVNCRLSKACCS